MVQAWLRSIGRSGALARRVLRHSRSAAPAGRPLAANSWMLVTVLTVVGVTVLIGWLLWKVADQAKEPATARLDAARIALAAGGGAGAGIGLLLAFRRQRHHEIDATEQRITELYIKAVEQLGAAEAPVRLGGLHALARLGQGNVTQRQTIADVICSYLRMPFPDKEPTVNVVRNVTPTREDIIAVYKREDINDALRESWGPERWRQEHEVRLTAQRILAVHLRDPERGYPEDQHWRNICLDLNGATLFYLDFGSCRLAEATFTRANFVGYATFTGTVFDDIALFNHATFDGIASFNATVFNSHAAFDYASFSNAFFDVAEFGDIGSFEGATFSGTVSLSLAIAQFDQESTWPSGWRVAKMPDDEGGVLEYDEGEDSASQH